MKIWEEQLMLVYQMKLFEFIVYKMETYNISKWNLMQSKEKKMIIHQVIYTISIQPTIKIQ